jgi:hypothetical protein
MSNARRGVTPKAPEAPRNFDICVSRSSAAVTTSVRYTLYAVTAAQAKAHGTRLFRNDAVTGVHVIERGVREWSCGRWDKGWAEIDREKVEQS